MLLRDYQQDVEQRIYQAWSKGARNVLTQLATGSGKTVIFTKIISDFKDYSVTVAHRMELVSQISLSLAKQGIRHRLIAQKPTIRNIVALHMQEIGNNYVNHQSRHAVAGVDTLLKLDADDPIFKKTRLLIQDEAHHVLRKNKWGKVAERFINAIGLYPTATPIRADGYGLGRYADGVIDEMIIGPPMRHLIKEGYLSDYKLICVKNRIDLSEVSIGASGDYSPPKLRNAVHKSKIVGDIVQNYLKFADGKLGITFAVDIEAATEITAAYKQAGVNAEVISSKTPDLLRARIMNQFRQKKVMQLVNVDLLGEGVDVPAVEVITLARPTASLSLFFQQFGRALRPAPGKQYAIVIDHVDNWVRHGLPDKPRMWSLDRRERRSKTTIDTVVQVKNCLNETCMAVYDRIHKVCPFCGYMNPIQQRSSPEQVDGDLIELDPLMLAKLRGEINRIDSAPLIPQCVSHIAQLSIAKRHGERQEMQRQLRDQISLYAGYYRALGSDDSEIYRRFYFQFGIDILTAQTLGSKEAEQLKNKIIGILDEILLMG